MWEEGKKIQHILRMYLYVLMNDDVLLGIRNIRLWLNLAVVFDILVVFLCFGWKLKTIHWRHFVEYYVVDSNKNILIRATFDFYFQLTILCLCYGDVYSTSEKKPYPFNEKILMILWNFSSEENKHRDKRGSGKAWIFFSSPITFYVQNKALKDNLKLVI